MTPTEGSLDDLAYYGFWLAIAVLLSVLALSMIRDELSIIGMELRLISRTLRRLDPLPAADRVADRVAPIVVPVVPVVPPHAAQAAKDHHNHHERVENHGQ